MTELNQKGLDLMVKMYGQRRVGDPIKAMAATGHPALPMIETVVACYGEVWGRPGLSLQQRSLVTMAMMLALNRPSELETHIRGALANGVTAEELWELANHAIWFLGLPALDTWLVAMGKVTADPHEAAK